MSHSVRSSKVPVLVTGGAGYIGSHTTKVLAHAGFQPVVLDDLSTGHRWAVRWGPLIEADLGDRAALSTVLKDYGIQAVVHFAARACVGDSFRDPRGYYRNNVLATLNLLDVMLDAGVNVIVFSSSCAVYGLPEVIPIPESHPQRPVSPYGETKLAVERALHWYSQAYGLRWLALRYFNAAGADPDGELGEVHVPETHLIPRAILAALGRAAPLEIYGTDYPTPDGTAVRDYIHVADLAEAHVLGLQYLLAGGESAALNLGTGRGYSVREVLAAVERISGRCVPVRQGPRRPGDPPALIADARRARELLGWRPSRSDLTTIIETAWLWYRSRQPFGVDGNQE
ncbi:UDP-glucose 4-epimerase GalE [Thermaerobacter composti]|uniref:UDP-glucose 4-epimerase n=1 Tax=Thermaerobacter composti TaxID=554949 RepID=A0ABZ0QQF1_9FIRM|nr:UDP-glucose 4-epimerase GalE [Thermaerobacter composti]WPD19725.1 UDP-glucose 4-epimerase GalE [Thermaerobacter composti]